MTRSYTHSQWKVLVIKFPVLPQFDLVQGLNLVKSESHESVTCLGLSDICCHTYICRPRIHRKPSCSRCCTAQQCRGKADRALRLESDLLVLTEWGLTKNYIHPFWNSEFRWPYHVAEHYCYVVYVNCDCLLAAIAVSPLLKQTTV